MSTCGLATPDKIHVASERGKIFLTSNGAGENDFRNVLQTLRFRSGDRSSSQQRMAYFDLNFNPTTDTNGIPIAEHPSEKATVQINMEPGS